MSLTLADPRRVRNVTPKILCAAILLYTAAQSAPVRGAIVVDGQFDEGEWREATQCGPWLRTEPFARDQPRYRNDVRLVATAEGLAAAFTLDQPPAERRVKPRMPRDAQSFLGDSVGLMIDFDATGQQAYEFSVGLGGSARDGTVTNQNQFDRDWDGDWQYAVRETADQWFVEILVPWQAVNMRSSRAATRTIGVYASRFLFDRNERHACPGIAEESPAFLADFKHIEVAQYDVAAAFDFVPYGTVTRDNLTDSMDGKVGADLSWKPSQNFWLTATLNPDFGQVESDELVVDFSAIETAFTDKRPFFTENQALFDLLTPANGQLIYTRRVGAAPDDGSLGQSDIDAALKLSGNAGSLDFGTFAAQEDDYDRGVGRLFGAARLRKTVATGRFGYLGTWTERPYLERRAQVHAFDADFTPDDDWRIAGQVIRSDIDAAGDKVAGHEAWLELDLNRSSSLTHSLSLLYIDADFDLNDLGYMERNSLHQVDWTTTRRIAKDGGRINGETQQLHLQYLENDAGERLPTRIQFTRSVDYRSRWSSFTDLRVLPGGTDDLISRGNGPVHIDTRYSGYADVFSPRIGNWQYVLGAYVFQQGIEGYSARLQMAARWYPHDKLTLRLDLTPHYTDDWLLWKEGTLFGTYRAPRLDIDFRLDWIPSPRHELRMRWQWIGVDATPRQAWRNDARGQLQPVEAAQIVPFTVNNLGLQIRYRYVLGPQSDFYAVYARGGLNLGYADDRNVAGLFRDMGQVRDADQFLLKLSYRLP